jgi:hypothetical protein
VFASRRGNNIEEIIMCAGLPGPALAIAGLGAWALLTEQRPLSRSEWLGRFEAWAGPASDTEDERVARTRRMVAEGISTALKSANYHYRLSFVAQGSSANNTNVKRNSDLDLVVVREDPWLSAWPGETLTAGMTNPFLSLNAEHAGFRRIVTSALEIAFGVDGIRQGDYCIEVPPSSARVYCDVLPAFRLHKMLPRSQWTSGRPTYIPGICFLTRGGEYIESFPEQHLDNGKSKNVATGYRYKKVVRVLKTFRRDFKDNQTILTQEPLPSSFEIESLVYNVPEAVLTAGDLYDAVAGTVAWLRDCLSSAADCNRLVQPNGFISLFAPWTTLGRGLLAAIAWDVPDGVTTAREFLDRIARRMNAA